MKWLDKRRAKKMKKEDEIKRRYDCQMKRLSKQNKAESEAMFSKPCPINKNHKCFLNCIHFQCGRVYSVCDVFVNGEVMYSVTRTSPRCKLWSK